MHYDTNTDVQCTYKYVPIYIKNNKYSKYIFLLYYIFIYYYVIEIQIRIEHLKPFLCCYVIIYHNMHINLSI